MKQTTGAAGSPSFLVRAAFGLFTAGALACILLLTGCGIGGKKTGADPASVRVKIAVHVDTARYRTLHEERRILGVLEAFREADLGPAQPGRVRSLPFGIGDRVKAGQTVARLDDAQLVGAIAQLQPLKAQYDRASSLYSAHAMSQAQFEAIEAQYIALKRQVEFLQENTVIKAPFSGVITALACEEGEMFSSPVMAGPGQAKGLIRITQLDSLKIDLPIDDKTIGYVRKGMQVALTVNRGADSTVQTFGRIEWVNPQADQQSRIFRARVVVANPHGTLKPGYFAEAQVILATKENALSVPRAAVVDDRVYIVRQDVAYVRSVKLGWVNDVYAEIDSGIDANSIVVVSGNKALPDSSPVLIYAGQP